MSETAGARFRAALSAESPLQVMGAITAYAGSWVMACVLEKFGVFGALYRGVFQPAIGPLLETCDHYPPLSRYSLDRELAVSSGPVSVRLRK